MAVRLGHPPKIQQLSLYATTEPCSVGCTAPNPIKKLASKSWWKSSTSQHYKTCWERTTWAGMDISNAAVAGSTGPDPSKSPTPKGMADPRKPGMKLYGAIEKPGNWWMQTHKTTPLETSTVLSQEPPDSTCGKWDLNQDMDEWMMVEPLKFRNEYILSSHLL